jgi:hypothetical protein
LSEGEWLSRYLFERVGDEERDYPGVMEMSVPHCIAVKHPACAQGVGRFLGAVNLPLLMRDVIIDIWGMGSGPSGPRARWATTTVDGIGHAVLERLCIDSNIGELLGGEVARAGTVSEVQIFARHPRSNLLIAERYSDQ